MRSMNRSRTLASVLAAGLVSAVVLLPIGGCQGHDKNGWYGEPYSLFQTVFIALCVKAVVLHQTGSARVQQASGPATVQRVVYLGSSAHSSGYVDTNWRTDVELHNAGDETATVMLERLEHGADNSAPQQTTVSLHPRQSLRLDDILMSEFSVDGKAALRVSTNGGAIFATNRTYNLLDEGNGLGLPAGATFGQYIPARSLGDGIASSETGRLVQLTHNHSARTNLGLVNLAAVPVTVEVDLHLGAGTKAGTVSVNLRPYEYRQLTRVFESVTSVAIDDGYAVVRVTTAGGRVLAQASVVDNLTGDPVFVPAIKTPPGAAAGSPMWILAAAHAGGVGGTNWRTDVEVHNPNDTTVAYTVELLPHMLDNSTPRSTTLTLGPGQSVRHADVLQALFGFGGTAALRVVPAGDPLLVTSRTYNLLGSGNPLGLPAGATFGQYIPAVQEGDAIAVGEEGRLIHLSQAATDTSGFRTNLILVNATPTRLAVEVDLMRADGARIGTEVVSLAPREFRQLNKVFQLVTQEEVEDGYAVVRTRTENGAFFALASVVDNLTGDPVGILSATFRAEPIDSLVRSAETVMAMLGGAGPGGEISLEALVTVLADGGTAGLVDDVESTLPAGVLTRTADGAVLEFGTGMEVNGQILAGRIDVVFSNVVVSGEAVRGTVVESHRDYTVNGIAPELGELRADVDLQVRGDGSVFGTVDVSARAAGAVTASPTAGAASLTGSFEIDSAICLYYPTGGSMTFSSPEVGAVTIRFGPDCDGSFDREVEPAWDRIYSYQDPSTAGAQDHIVLVSNAQILDDAYARYWIPSVGGTEFASRQQPGDTPPAVIRYHFSFDRPIQAGHLLTCMPAYYFGYSRAQNYLLGSTDGTSWTTLLEVVNPNEDTAVGGCFNADLPASMLGATDLWLQVELYCWGPSAPGGAPLTNTAQHSRFGKQDGGTTFELKVRCSGGGCGSG